MTKDSSFIDKYTACERAVRGSCTLPWGHNLFEAVWVDGLCSSGGGWWNKLHPLMYTLWLRCTSGSIMTRYGWTAGVRFSAGLDFVFVTNSCSSPVNTPACSWVDIDNLLGENGATAWSWPLSFFWSQGKGCVALYLHSQHLCVKWCLVSTRDKFTFTFTRVIRVNAVYEVTVKCGRFLVWRLFTNSVSYLRWFVDSEVESMWEKRIVSCFWGIVPKFVAETEEHGHPTDTVTMRLRGAESAVTNCTDKRRE
jgi:hypothetical protein